MIVSHQHRFIFIKTTKTAGTSLEIALSRYCGPDDIITGVEEEDEQVRNDLGGKGPLNDALPFRCYRGRDWRMLLKGKAARIRSHTPAALARSIVGNEVWDSYFKFSIERNPYDKAISRYYWGIKRMDPKPTMLEFFSQIPERKLTNWPIYGIGESVAVDFVIRYEHLAEDLEIVRNRIGLPEPIEMPITKGGYRKDRRDYRDILEPASRARVEEVCRRELREFGYSWDPH